MLKLSNMTKVPSKLQGILWSRDVTELDIKKDKKYIIHQILAYGSWNHLKWLFKNYKVGEIRKVFIEHPAKDYTEKTFNFIERIVLEISSKGIDKRYYVKTYPRIIG